MTKSISNNAITQKNTLLKTAEANAAIKVFKRVFFSPPQENFFPPFLFLIKLFSPSHEFTANTTSCAFNVNRFEQSVCGLETVVLRGNSTAAANKKLSENFKKGGCVGYRKYVLSIYICA